MSQQIAGKITKAAYSGAVAGLGALATVLTGQATFSDLTDGQWVTLALTTLIAAGGTFGLSGWSGPSVNGNTKPSP